VCGFLYLPQALADYATLVYALREEYNAVDNAVIAFGGSYGGMLASWFRIKYPNAVDGAIGLFINVPA
jgi:lysosomal Pro-X carboxypeptidase